MYDAHVNKIFSSQFTIISNKQKMVFPIKYFMMTRYV